MLIVLHDMANQTTKRRHQKKVLLKSHKFFTFHFLPSIVLVCTWFIIEFGSDKVIKILCMDFHKWTRAKRGRKLAFWMFLYTMSRLWWCDLKFNAFVYLSLWKSIANFCCVVCVFMHAHSHYLLSITITHLTVFLPA